MKKTLWILAGTLIFGSAALAADSACPLGNLTDYGLTGSNEALGTDTFTCHIGNLDFSQFYIQDSAAPSSLVIKAGDIAVTPITTALNQGLDFNPGINVNNTPGGSNSFQDVKIGFTVTTVDGSKTIDDLGIGFNGSFTGTGSTNFVETWGPTAPPSCGSCSFNVTNPPINLVNEVVLSSPTNTISVLKDVNGATGTDGSAFISDFKNQFSQVVPEPAYTALLAAGLFGLGWLRKRRQSQV
jgi:hypothetical protein